MRREYNYHKLTICSICLEGDVKSFLSNLISKIPVFKVWWVPFHSFPYLFVCLFVFNNQCYIEKENFEAKSKAGSLTGYSSLDLDCRVWQNSVRSCTSKGILLACTDASRLLHFSIKPHLKIVSPRTGDWRSLSPICMFANPKNILTKKSSESYSCLAILNFHSF